MVIFNFQFSNLNYMKSIYKVGLLFIILNFQFSILNKVSAQQTINIYTTTQGIVSFTFAEKPQITFPAPEVLKLDAGGVVVEFPYADVAKLTLEDEVDPTAVQSVTVYEQPAADGQCAVGIYDLSGRLIRKVNGQSSTVNVQLSDLPAGVYIVNDGKRSYKIQKK